MLTIGAAIARANDFEGARDLLKTMESAANRVQIHAAIANRAISDGDFKTACTEIRAISSEDLSFGKKTDPDNWLYDINLNHALRTAVSTIVDYAIEYPDGGAKGADDHMLAAALMITRMQQDWLMQAASFGHLVSASSVVSSNKASATP